LASLVHQIEKSNQNLLQQVLCQPNLPWPAPQGELQSQGAVQSTVGRPPGLTTDTEPQTWRSRFAGANPNANTFVSPPSSAIQPLQFFRPSGPNRRGCFICGQLNHLKRNCPYSNEGSGGKANSGAVETNPTAKVARHPAAGDPVYLALTINGITEPVLFDTGCSVNVLPIRLAPPGSWISQPVQLVAANGSPIWALGHLEIDILLNDYCVNVSFLVSREINEAILGMQFLRQHPCYWDFTTSTLILDGRRMLLTPQSPKSKLRRVMVAENTVLPPRSQTEVELLAPLHSLSAESLECLIESRQVRAGVALARTLVPANQPRVRSCFINTNDEPVVLSVDQCIGEMEVAELCEPPGESTHMGPHAATTTCRTMNNAVLSSLPSKPSPESKLLLADRKTKVTQVIEDLVKDLPPELDAHQIATIVQLMTKYQDILSVDDFDIGYTDLVSHRICTGDHPPIREALRRHPQAYMETIDQHVATMLQQGVIEPANSPWAANVVLVRKKDNTLRCAIDYRRLNQVNRKDSYPLPHIDSCLDALNSSAWFTTLDLRSGYWQVRQAPEDADKTAFVTRRGCYRFKVLSFGLCGAPGLFQRLMDLVMSGLTWSTMLVYLDDLVIFAKTFEEHHARLAAVLGRLRAANLKLKPSKCHFFQKKIQFLGYIVSEKGLETDPDKIRVIKEWPALQNVAETRSFIGLCSYYRKFVPGFADLAAPLHDLTKKGVRFQWTEKHQAAFDELKHRLTSTPILSLPRDEGQFLLDTDASNEALGLILSQVTDGEEHVIAYASRRYSQAEHRYCITRKELLGIIYGLRQFRQYLLGRQFLVRTDHEPLTWLYRSPQPIGQQARWLDLIAEYTFEIQHRPGRLHSNVDAVSRVPQLCRQCGRDESCYDLSGQQTSEVSKCRSVDQSTNNLLLQIDLNPPTIRQLQLQDPTIAPVINYLESQTDVPNHDQLLADGKETRNYCGQWPQLTLLEGVLFRRFVDAKNQTRWLQLVAPRAIRPDILKLCHEGMTGGHLGLKKT